MSTTLPPAAEALTPTERVFLRRRLRLLLGRLDGLLGQASPLVAGRVLAAALTFAVPLVLTRTLSRAAFGTYKQFFLIVSTVSLIGQLGLTQSLYYFLPRGGRERGAYVTQALAALAAVGLVFACGIGLLPWFGPFRWPLAVFAACMLATSPLEATLTSEGRIGTSAAVFVLFEGLRAAALVGGALWLGGLAGCLWAATGVMLVRLLGAWALAAFRVLPGARPTRETMSRQLAYALPYAGSAVLYVVQRQLGQYVVSVHFDAATFALFSVAMFHLMAVDIIYSPVSEVLIVRLGRAAAAGDFADARAAWHDAVLRLAELFLPLAALLWAVGSALLPALFTRKYQASVPIFAMMTLEVPVAVLALDAVMRAAAETRFLLWINATRVVLTLALVVAGIATLGLPGAAAGAVASELVGRLLMLGRARRFLRAGLRDLLPWRALAGIAARAAVPVLPALLLVRRLGDQPRAAAGAGMVAYALGWLAVRALRRRLRGSVGERADAVLHD
jgi:O-antigen/teichoic acid export membrane protein